jgi:choline dehydrogenase-like flavoprotein
MTLLDLRELADETVLTADICIIGSGPAGMTIAKEFARGPFSTLVVESGGSSADPATGALNDVENIGAQRVDRQDLVRNRQLGGSSTTWSGRCTTFDEIDFETRAWVPNSGWPISRTELDPYLERARPHLGLGPHAYDGSLWPLLGRRPPKRELDGALLTPRFWQFSRCDRDKRSPTRFTADVLPQDAANVDILAHANVTHINTPDTGDKVQSLSVRALNGHGATVVAREYVLCCGGIENARLLLASNKTVPAGLGNQHDLVGRYLMDHPGTILGTLAPLGSEDVRDDLGYYWMRRPGSRYTYLHGVGLSPEVQRAEELLNASMFLDVCVDERDPWRAARRVVGRLRGRQVGSADDSAVAYGRERAGIDQDTPSTRQDVASLIRDSGLLGRGVGRTLRGRPPLYRPARIDLYALVEQAPDRTSRVTLSGRRDALGVPISRIDWKVNPLELRTTLRLAELVDQEFARCGYPRPDLFPWLRDEAQWRTHVLDRAHPIGTTRMSSDPRTGVVDSYGRVFGVGGLHVAGSSTFPTSGHANPTLMIVALAVRLADRLKAALGPAHIAGGALEAVRGSSPRAPGGVDGNMRSGSLSDLNADQS